MKALQLTLVLFCYQKAMREVSKSWQDGFEDSVVKMKITSDGPPPPRCSFRRRFPRLANLHLGDCPMAESQLDSLAGLKQLTILNLGKITKAAGYHRLPESKRPIAFKITGTGLGPLRCLPLTVLSLRGYESSSCQFTAQPCSVCQRFSPW